MPRDPQPNTAEARRKYAVTKPGAMLLDDACIYLGNMPMAAVYDLIALGEIDGVKRGNRTMVLTASMDAYLSRLPKAVINLSSRGAAKRERERAETAARFEALNLKAKRAVAEDDAA
jgi:hypothetical protein